MGRRILVVVALLFAASALQTPPAAARSSEITADLDGAPIPATDAGRYFCHDLEYPHLRCFSTAEALEAAMIDRTQEGILALAVYGTNDYVTIYSEPAFAGSYAHLSQSYDGLWVIGWNDRISSFKGRNSGRGSFHVDWYAGGARLDFCCNQTAASLNGTFNDAISSVYRKRTGQQEKGGEPLGRSVAVRPASNARARTVQRVSSNRRLLVVRPRRRPTHRETQGRKDPLRRSRGFASRMDYRPDEG